MKSNDMTDTVFLNIAIEVVESLMVNGMIKREVAKPCLDELNRIKGLNVKRRFDIESSSFNNLF